MSSYVEKMAMNILVIGVGSIGTRHWYNLLSLGHEVQTYDIKSGQPFSPSIAVRLDGVVISTPPDSHLKYMQWAADRGLPFLVEKPLSDSLDGLEGLIYRAREVPALVGYQLRHLTTLVAAKRELEKLGKIYSARAEFGQFLPDWRPNQDYRQSYTARLGIILDASHEIDYLRWLLGEVVQVSCFAGKLSSLEVKCEDTADILLRFVSGAIASLHVDFIQKTYVRYCHILGENGILIWDYTRGLQLQVNEHSFVVPTEHLDPYKLEMTHFINCIRGIEQPKVTIQDGFETLKVALEARRQGWIN